MVWIRLVLRHTSAHAVAQVSVGYTLQRVSGRVDSVTEDQTVLDSGPYKPSLATAARASQDPSLKTCLVLVQLLQSTALCNSRLWSCPNFFRCSSQALLLRGLSRLWCRHLMHRCMVHPALPLPRGMLCLVPFSLKHALLVVVLYFYILTSGPYTLTLLADKKCELGIREIGAEGAGLRPAFLPS
jgi:hypothetical protein